MHDIVIPTRQVAEHITHFLHQHPFKWSQVWMLCLGYGIFNHAINLPRIRRWNKLPKERRIELWNYRDTDFFYSKLCRLLGFLWGCTFGLPSKLAYFGVRLTYNFVIRWLLSGIVGEALPAIRSLREFNEEDGDRDKVFSKERIGFRMPTLSYNVISIACLTS